MPVYGPDPIRRALGVTQPATTAPQTNTKQLNLYRTAATYAPLRTSVMGYPVRKPYPSEDKFFQGRPDVAGMAAEDNAIIHNPYAARTHQNRELVANNEAIRLHMREGNYTSQFPVSPAQQQFYKGTEYANNPNAMRQTIIARILTGDDSAMATPEQETEADAYLTNIRTKYPGWNGTVSAPTAATPKPLRGTAMTPSRAYSAFGLMKSLGVDPSKSYNTPLTPTQETQYQGWAKQNNRPPDETDSYDMRGAWLNNISGDNRGHFPDTYKKPNPTSFSTDSQYESVDVPGGTWAQTPEKQWSFAPSSTNLLFHPPKVLKRYFQQYNPTDKLLLP